MTQEKRKLIEVAVPLEAINAACKADKDRKTGTIRNLHKWFAPMPSPAWRALLFASLVDDPGDQHERERLWKLIEELVASGPVPPPQRVLDKARGEIERCNPDGLPLIVDPFCGGGSTILEAQRLGLPAFASDLNPVPVLITRFLCELLPKIAGHKPISGEATGLAVDDDPFAGFKTDVHHYASLIRQEVQAEIGGHYPDGPDGEHPYAWIWSRTVCCPNPACQTETLLVTSWWLSKKKGEEAWLEPYVSDGQVRARVATGPGHPPKPIKHGRGANFECCACGQPIGEAYVQSEGQHRRLGQRLMAIAGLDGKRRVFIEADAATEDSVLAIQPPGDSPHVALADDPRSIWCVGYGVVEQADLYTSRQLVALDAFARAVARLPERLARDGASPDYCRAISVFSGLALSRLAQHMSTQTRWRTRDGPAKAEAAFGRHDLPMTWDFAEVNPFGGSVGDWLQTVATSLRAIDFATSAAPARVAQADARAVASELPRQGALVATDPPYFAHIGYADLSDYFYVWLRRALRDVEADLFATIQAPRDGELIALAQRHHGDKLAAYEYFVEGFREVFQSLHGAQRSDLPMLVVYAHREEDGGNGNTGGWPAMLDAILRAGHQIVGTLPLHATGAQRMVSLGTNALATYVVMVCRPRPADAKRIERRDLDKVMRAELRAAVVELQRAAITPVDLAQAVIGPGMAIFSRYSEVLEADGNAMKVSAALQLINRTLGEILDEQETDLDPESRWAAAWFDEHGYGTGAYGQADALSRAKGIAVDTLDQAGIVEQRAGKVRLLSRGDLDADWTPEADARPTTWEAVQHLMQRLEEGGETGAAVLYAQLGALTEPARELAYRLFLACERRKLTDEAVAVNGLVRSWPEIARLAESMPVGAGTQEAFFEA